MLCSLDVLRRLRCAVESEGPGRAQHADVPLRLAGVVEGCGFRRSDGRPGGLWRLRVKPERQRSDRVLVKNASAEVCQFGGGGADLCSARGHVCWTRVIQDDWTMLVVPVVVVMVAALLWKRIRCGRTIVWRRAAPWDGVTDAKPVPIKASGPAAAAAAARHEVKVTQLEDQLASHQRDLQATRSDLQHAARCFDAAMVMVNYLSNEYNPFQLTEEVKALQSRATEIQLALDEAAATQRRLEESLEERERARQERETEVSAELAALTSQHQTALESSRQELADVRAAWHQERQLLEQDLRQQQEARDRDLRQLSSQHQQTLASVTAQWERELAEGQRRSQQQADQLRGQIAALEEQTCELSRREEELKVALGKSSDTRIQVLSARIKEKEKDVRSLNAVLELKKEEIAALRRDQLELQRLRERNARLEESCTKYRAKAEDLEAQLRQRALAERQLSEENTRLRDCQDREAKAYKRLSMENEQLQYKLRNQSDSQGTPGVLSRSASFRSPRTPTSFTRACSESPHTSRISPRSPLKSDSLRRRSRRSEEASPPPQVTAVVEKSDSISWVLDMEASGRGSSAEPDEAGEPSADRRLGPRAGSSSPPSAKGLNGAGSESSDSDAADHDNGVFYQLGGPASAPGSLTVSLPDQHDMHDIPESSEGTEI